MKYLFLILTVLSLVCIDTTPASADMFPRLRKNHQEKKETPRRKIIRKKRKAGEIRQAGDKVNGIYKK